MLLLAFDLIDKEVHIDWPILKKARVHSLWTAEKKFALQFYKFPDVVSL